MFTPQKTGFESNLLAYCSGSFEYSLRKYRSPSKQKSSNKELVSLHKHSLVPLSNEQRLKRYARVREEEMARSRSRAKELMKSKDKYRIAERSPLKSITNSIEILDIPQLRIGQPPMHHQQPVPLTICMQVEDQKKGEEEAENEIRGAQTGFRTSEEIKEQTSDDFGDVNFHQGPVIQTSCQPPANKSEELRMENQMSIECHETISMQIESQHCPSTSIPKFFEAERSDSCIIFKNRDISYRISLRQLAKAWKKLGNLDSLVHYIANQKPHLAPLKEIIADALHRHLF